MNNNYRNNNNNNYRKRNTNRGGYNRNYNRNLSNNESGGRPARNNRNYIDNRFDGTDFEYQERMNNSSTIYVGNLAFSTTEEQLYNLFGTVGSVKDVIVGINSISRTPCGFCFVEYYLRSEALTAVACLSGMTLNDRRIRCELDHGFLPGREFGRGKGGFQVRDELRSTYDKDRGGLLNMN